MAPWPTRLSHFVGVRDQQPLEPTYVGVGTGCLGRRTVAIPSNYDWPQNRFASPVSFDRRMGFRFMAGLAAATLTSMDSHVVAESRTRAYMNVDAHAEPEVLLNCLGQVETFGPHVEVRHLTYHAIPGGAGVDVGCGHGRAVAELVELGVPALGVDRSDVMVKAAQRRFPSCTFVLGDALSVPFPDGSMRWYRAERVYLHLPDPLAALAEARRVLSPGGTIIVADQDFDSTVITSSHPDLTRKLTTMYTDDLPNGRIGSRMRGLLANAGFTDISVSAHPIVFTDLELIGPYIPSGAISIAVKTGALSVEQADDWMADLQAHARRQQFLLAYAMFITTARAPGRSAK